MIFSLNSTNWWRKFIVFGLMFGLLGCQPPVPDELHIAGPTMGTSYNIKIVDLQLDTELFQGKVDARLAEINGVFSTYIPDSEISRINRSSSELIRISAEMAEVLLLSQEIYELSDRAFDVTVGPLVNLWGFGPEGPANGIPPAEAIESAKATTGFHRLSLNAQQLTKPESIYVDLSAVAKGYAVDEIAELVEAAGGANYMVEIGGEVRARGKNRRGIAWVLGIESPTPEVRQLQRTVPLNNLSMATSGDYRNFFEYEGQVYSHTIDPRTGWPVTHNLGSITVLHESAGMADGLATAFSVLGLEESMALAEQMDLMIFAIIRSETGYEERLSSALQRYLENQ